MSEAIKKVIFRLPEDTPLSVGPAQDSSIRPADNDQFSLLPSKEQTSFGWISLELISDSKYPARPLSLQLPPQEYELVVYAQKRLEEAELLGQRGGSTSVRLSLTAAAISGTITGEIKSRTNNPVLESILNAIELREANLYT